MSRYRDEGTTSFVTRCRALVRRGGGESGDAFAGASTIRATPMTARTTEKSHALVRKLEGHRAHDEGVRETRPSGEGDEASMRGRVTRGDQQENTERDVKAQHHVVAIIFRGIGMP